MSPVLETPRAAKRPIAGQRFVFRCYTFPASDGKGFLGECIDLDLIVHARTCAEAVQKLNDAIAGYVATVAETGDLEGLIPRRSPFSRRLRYHLACLRSPFLMGSRRSFALHDIPACG